MPAGEPKLPKVDHKAILTRFLAVNEARLRRTRDALRQRQRDFLDVLPLLFHTNHPGLPGYISRDVPAGVPDCQVDGPVLAAAQRIAPGFRHSRKAMHQLPILAIFFMGSPGSVAYSEDSDFDIWLCHDPALSEDEVALLQRKASAIEQWADGIGLEVHFFLINHERFHAGPTQALDAESSGSAQHLLLLDEFYRTGLHLAGRYPLWWLVPPDEERDYEAYGKTLGERPPVNMPELIDFGGLGQVPAEEFLGAAIWQLNKGIDSPYKSVLKLLLIESYASEYPESELLSVRFKRAVYEGQHDVDRLDPYLSMLDRVESFLDRLDEPHRKELARRCFYFKVNENLSRERSDLAPWRRDLLMERINAWGWSRADLYLMDSRCEWKVHRVLTERRVLFDALSESYRFLSDFARRFSGQNLITQQDLTLLGRKLFAAFERKAGKIELINRGINANLVEERLTIYETLDDQQRSAWVLFAGLVPPDEAVRAVPVRRARSVTELVAWCFFNEVLDRATAIAVYTRRSPFGNKDIRAMVEQLYQLFPKGAAPYGKLDHYREPARLARLGLFANVGHDEFIPGEGTGRLAAGSSDPLSYGPHEENLVRVLDLVYVTSWREVLTNRFAGRNGIAECLCELLKWSGGHGDVEALEVFAFGAARSGSVSRRLEALVDDVRRAFALEDAHDTRYVLRVDRSWLVLLFEDGVPTYRALANDQELFKYLAAAQPGFRRTVFDRFALRDPALPLIYRENRSGCVQLFFRISGGEAEVFVLDERGSLFRRRVPYHDAESLVSHFGRFFESVMNRMNFLQQEGTVTGGIEGMEFHLIENGTPGSPSLKRFRPTVTQGRRYLSLQVIVDADDTGRTNFNLYCNDREFSSLERGARVFEDVVRYVLEQRASGKTYPVHITDISMSPAVLGENAGRLQTVHFLNYKHRIEEKLNAAMGRALNG